MSNQMIISQGVGTPSAVKIDFYKLFWIFLIGSVLGFIYETIWCFFAHDHLEWHSSLIGIPFTAVYGCGALVLYMVTKLVKSKKLLHLFVFGAVLCTVVEYLSSLLQEMIFGTVSWDYSNDFLNIEGRVCLPVSIVWGIITILWVWIIQPLFEKLISKIPIRIYKPLTWILVSLILINTIISVTAVSRWIMRLEGVPSTNVLTDALDRIFTDDFMKKFYPKMKFRI